MQDTSTIQTEELMLPTRLLYQPEAEYRPCHLLLDERFQQLQPKRRELRMRLQRVDNGSNGGVLLVGLRPRS
jgi:hypothetical protein